MTTDRYLRLIKKLDLLIRDTEGEKEVLRTLAEKVTQENDGMPHATGTSDKVGNIAVKLVMKDQELDDLIDLFVELRSEIVDQLRKLPTNEYKVLYDFYVAGKRLFDIADEQDCSVDWIKKLKWRGLSKVKVIESETYKKVVKKVVT